MGDRWRPETGYEWMGVSNKRLDILERRRKGVAGSGPTALWQSGTISQTYSGGLPTVVLSDGTIVTNVAYTRPYQPERGQRVTLAMINGQLTILAPTDPIMWADFASPAGLAPYQNAGIINTSYFGRPMVGKSGDGYVNFRGLIYVTAAITAGQLIATLPPEFRPLWTVYCPGNRSDTYFEFRVDPDGSVYSQYAAAAGSYFSWNNMAWPTDPTMVWTNISDPSIGYQPGWGPATGVAGSPPVPGVCLDKNGVVWTRGQIARTSGSSTNAFIVPASVQGDMRPEQQSYAIYASNGNVACWIRNVSGTNTIWQYNVGNVARMSLDSSPYFANASWVLKRPMSWTAPWVSLGATFTQLAYRKTPGGFVIVQGMGVSGAGNAMFYMPPDPGTYGGSRLGLTISGNSFGRYDLQGQLAGGLAGRVTTSIGTTAWTSLDSMFWIAEDPSYPGW